MQMVNVSNSNRIQAHTYNANERLAFSSNDNFLVLFFSLIIVYNNFNDKNDTTGIHCFYYTLQFLAIKMEERAKKEIAASW